MGKNLRNRLIFSTALGFALFVTHFTGAASKPKADGLQSVQNKNCGFYFRYPKKSQLEHPSDCALKVIFPAKGLPEWAPEMTITLYTAPLDQPTLGETPAGEADPSLSGTIKGGGMTFQKTIYMDAAMSHQMITVVYEGLGAYRKYRFEGYMRAANPEVMDKHPKDWDSIKFAEKTFDKIVATFVPMK